MRLTALLFLSLCLSSCQKAGEASSSTPGCDASNETCLFDVAHEDYTTDTEGDVPDEAHTFTTDLSLDHFTPAQQDKIDEAAEVIKTVVASKEFRAAILNHTYNGQKTFVENGGLTNAEIYHRLLQGAEKLSPAKNNTLDAELELYFEETGTVGYTTPATTRIFMNTKFFNSYTPAQVAGNLMHEWMHKIGFGHTTKNTPERPYTVPYAVGYLMTRLGSLP